MSLAQAPIQVGVLQDDPTLISQPWARWLLDLVTAVNTGGGITGFVPYTGATADLDLGAHSIFAANLTGSNTGDQAIELTGGVSGVWSGGVIPVTVVDLGTCVGTQVTLTGSLIEPFRDLYLRGMTLGLGSGDHVENTVMGYQSLASTTTGKNNIAIGYQTLKSNLTGHENIAIGYQALTSSLSCTDSVAIGFQALTSTTQAVRSVAIGSYAMFSMGTSSDNVAIGFGALQNATVNFENIAIGTFALSAARSVISTLQGTANLAIGYTALQNLTIGFGNIALGASCGTSITSGDYNILIGYGNSTLAITDANCVVLGSHSTGAGSNTVTIGNSSMTDNYFWGSLHATGQLISTVAVGTAPLVITSTTVVPNLTTGGNALLAGATTQAFDAAALGVTGNLTLKGAGRILFGDFSDATPSNRAALQSSIAGGATRFDIIPNGTGTIAQIQLHGDSARTNGNVGAITISAAGFTFNSSFEGTGTTGPMLFNIAGVTAVTVDINRNLIAATTVNTGNYTVATLPAGTRGMRAYVTDALGPTFLVAVIGGGAVVTPVFYNGAAWVAN